MRLSVIVAIAILAVGCGGRTAQKAENIESQKDGVEVLCFYGKQRCVTCIEIEKLTEKVVHEHFAKQIADSTLRLQFVDITANQQLADKHEVSWSSLIVNRRREGVEQAENLTKMAFATARSNPEKFSAQLIEAINKQLK